MCIRDRYINVHYPWFGFSPDGFVENENGILCLIEIESPLCGKRIASTQLNEKNLKNVGGILKLKQRNYWYGQIQLGLFLFGRQEGKLLIHCSADDNFKEVRVPYDETFCNRYIDTLTNLYFKYYLSFLLTKKVHLLQGMRKG